jgi:hypothetical protein
MQPVELPVEVDRPVALPEQPDHPQRFLEPGDGPGEVEPVRQGVLAFAAAETEDESAAGQVVDGQRGLSQHRGMAADGVDDGGDQRDVLRQRRGCGGYCKAVEMAMR